MAYIHETMAQGRWHELSLFDQMANIGADVGRAIKWQMKGDRRSSQTAFERALELFDLTLEDPKHKGRYREIARAREVVCDFFVGDNQYHSTPKSLENYFYPFNLAARKQHQKSLKI